MLGMGDLSIFAAYVLCILAAIACVVYGIINWNKGADTEAREIEEEQEWEKAEKDISEKLDI